MMWIPAIVNSVKVVTLLVTRLFPYIAMIVGQLRTMLVALIGLVGPMLIVAGAVLIAVIWHVIRMAAETASAWANVQHTVYGIETTEGVTEHSGWLWLTGGGTILRFGIQFLQFIDFYIPLHEALMFAAAICIVKVGMVIYRVCKSWIPTVS